MKIPRRKKKSSQKEIYIEAPGAKEASPVHELSVLGDMAAAGHHKQGSAPLEGSVSHQLPHGGAAPVLMAGSLRLTSPRCWIG